MENYFTDKEFKISYDKFFNAYMLSSKANKKPIAYMILGQPGSGKSFFSNTLLSFTNKDFCYIDGDYFRKYHPNSELLYLLFGDESVLKKNAFVNAMVEKIIIELSIKKRNLLIQGTLRSLDVFFNTVDILKRMGYYIAIIVIATKPMISYSSSICRYERMVYYGLYPRKIYENLHNQIAYSISDKIDYIYKFHNLFDNFVVYNRFQECIFSSSYKIRNPASCISETLFCGWKCDEIKELDRIKYEIDCYKENKVVYI